LAGIFSADITLDNQKTDSRGKEESIIKEIYEKTGLRFTQSEDKQRYVVTSIDTYSILDALPVLPKQPTPEPPPIPFPTIIIGNREGSYIKTTNSLHDYYVYKNLIL